MEEPSDDFEAPNKLVTLFVIEVSKSMLEKHPFGRHGRLASALELALEAADESTRSSVSTGNWGEVGVIFYGVNNKDAQNNCFEYLELKKQNIDGINKLRYLAKMSKLRDELLVPATTTTAMGDVFTMAINEFEKSRVKDALRQMILVTDNEHPHAEDKLAHAARSRAGDLVQMGVTILPIFISAPGKPFRPRLFWEDMPYVDPYRASTDIEDLDVHPIETLEIKGMIETRTTPRAHAVKSTLDINGHQISVKAYRLIKKRDPPQTIKINTVGTQEVKLETGTTHVTVNGREVPKEQLGYAYRFGDKNVADQRPMPVKVDSTTRAEIKAENKLFIPITKEELEKLRYFGERSIKVLSFQSLDETELPFGPFSYSHFIYPNDADISGSMRLYVALYQMLIKERLVAVVSSVMQSNQAPRTGILFASEPKRYTDSPRIYRSQPGIYLVHLPYIDEVRHVPFDALEYGAVNQRIADATRGFVDPLTKKSGYNPREYVNPRHAWMDLAIECTALSMEMPNERPKDKTKPKYQSIDTRAGDKIAEFQAAVDALGFNSNKDTESSEAPRPKKRTKVAPKTKPAA